MARGRWWGSRGMLRCTRARLSTAVRRRWNGMGYANGRGGKSGLFCSPNLPFPFPKAGGVEKHLFFLALKNTIFLLL